MMSRSKGSVNAALACVAFAMGSHVTCDSSKSFHLIKQCFSPVPESYPEDNPAAAAEQGAPKASARCRKPAGNHGASPRKDKAAAGPGPGDISMTSADMVAALLSVKQFQAAADPLRRSATSVGPSGSSLQVQQIQGVQPTVGHRTEAPRTEAPRHRAAD